MDSPSKDESAKPVIGVVAIGRNEGQRLVDCLDSLIGKVDAIVYVDSGSDDGSQAMAREKGVHVVDLDTSIPFTAARARNAGFERLRELQCDLNYVQFLDGDCTIAAHWIATATAYLEDHPKVAVVCGQRRERFPEVSVYNMLCDLEWDTPIGQADACGGDAMIRAEALTQIHGYNPALIAGEEPEMCARLRQADWTIWRIDHDMTWHDAAMTRFGQWWKRAVRAGHAFAEVAAIHGTQWMGSWVKQVRSIWLWTVLLGLIAVAPAYWTYGLSLLVFGLYPLWAVKIAIWYRRINPVPWRMALYYGIFIMIGKWALLKGMLVYRRNRWTGRSAPIMEYKAPA